MRKTQNVSDFWQYINVKHRLNGFVLVCLIRDGSFSVIFPLEIWALNWFLVQKIDILDFLYIDLDDDHKKLHAYMLFYSLFI